MRVCVNSDLTDANLDGTNLTGENLSGVTVKPAGAEIGHGRQRSCYRVQVAGPALTELDAIFDKAPQGRRAVITLSLSKPDGSVGQVEIGIGSIGKSHHAYASLRELAGSSASKAAGRSTCSNVLLYLGRIFGQFPVPFGEIDVTSTKTAKRGKELHRLVLEGIAEGLRARAAGGGRPRRGGQGVSGREDTQPGQPTTRNPGEDAKAPGAKEKEKAKKQIAKKRSKRPSAR